MNEDIIQGRWTQVKGSAKRQWGKLTDDDLDIAEGNRDYLIGKIQERTGRAREEIEIEVNDFEGRIQSAIRYAQRYTQSHAFNATGISS